jgi:hypothetical protein
MQDQVILEVNEAINVGHPPEYMFQNGSLPIFGPDKLSGKRKYK